MLRAHPHSWVLLILIFVLTGCGGGGGGGGGGDGGGSNNAGGENQPPNTPLTFTQPPLDATVYSGATARFDAQATGSNLSYQWLRNGVAISGQTESSLYIPATTQDDNGAQITVRISNATNNIISPAATLNVLPQGLSLFAGTAGGSGYIDDSTISARFDHPNNIVLDSAGNMYVADTSNAVIRKITKTGVVSTFAGGGAGNNSYGDGVGTQARFSNPKAIAIDRDGNFLVPDLYALRKITPTGVVTSIAAPYISSSGIATDNSGNTYLTNELDHVVYKVDVNGTFTIFAGAFRVPDSTNGSGGGARFNGPTGISIDSSGNLYIADTNNHIIRKITPAGTVTTLAGLAGASGSTNGMSSSARFSSPQGTAIDKNGNLYVADTDNHIIRKITQQGSVSTFAGTPLTNGANDGAAVEAKFYNPKGLALDSAQNLYVADTWNHVIRKILPTGVVSTVAGSAVMGGALDGKRIAAQFGYAYGIAIDHNHNVYVSDSTNSTIRKITPEGIVTTLVGAPGESTIIDGDHTTARLKYPTALTIDFNENLYVADASTIRRISLDGSVTTIAGSPTTYGYANGAGASALLYPSGITTDSSGNLYVSECTNSTIRKITPGGVVTTLAGVAGVYGDVDGSGSNARLNCPMGVATDSHNNIFVADSSNCKIRKVTPAGVTTTVPSTANCIYPNYSNSDIRMPVGIAIDAIDNMYVIEQPGSLPNDVLKITPSGSISLFIGSRTTSTFVGGALPGSIYGATGGIAMDAQGAIYISAGSGVMIAKP